MTIFRDVAASLGKTNADVKIYYLIRRKKTTWNDRDEFYLCPVRLYFIKVRIRYNVSAFSVITGGRQTEK